MAELRIQLVEGGRGLRLITAGAVPGSVFVDAHVAVAELEAPRLADCRWWFSDHAALDGRLLQSIDATAVAHLSRRIMRLVPRLAIANLARGDLEFGMFRMWESLAVEDDGWVVATFREDERDRVADWLSTQVGASVDPAAPASGAPLFEWRGPDPGDA